MNDKKRSLELETDVDNLNNELDNYCLNVRQLTEDEKCEIKELYKIWKSCLNKKIVIETIQHTNIRVSDKINFSDGTIIWDDIQRHHSLHFVDCSNATIVISAKVNHITFERCKNVNVRITGGSISGIDIIHCTNVTHIFESCLVYFVDISNTTECSFILSERIAKDIMITTASSFNLQFKTISDDTGIRKNIYRTNMNVFQNYAVYSFHVNNDDLSLYIAVPHSNILHLVLPN